jgi:very-short-patch-repair endonuclease
MFLAAGAPTRHIVRDTFLQSQGFRVLRLWNSDIDANLAGVMERILIALKRFPPA